jgi:hypothetical protein
MGKMIARWNAVLVALLLVLGCGGSRSGSPAYAPESSPEAAAGEAPPPAAPGQAPAYGAGADMADMESEAPDDGPPPSAAKQGQAMRTTAPEPKARPGLGTAWGETRQSRTTSGTFERHDPRQPFGVMSLYYNDREGANAMARDAGYRASNSSTVAALNGGITVHVQDEGGAALPGFQAGGRQYVIGAAGSRYTIVVRNYSNFRFEVVAAVDGLDVIDGKPGSFSKRGYILDPNSTLNIEGFRRSADAVAAFRFSSVRQSYASKGGKGTRNVGVIGVALFHERGTQPVWTQGEIDRRHQADPFPNRYAEPPTR